VEGCPKRGVILVAARVLDSHYRETPIGLWSPPLFKRVKFTNSTMLMEFFFLYWKKPYYVFPLRKIVSKIVREGLYLNNIPKAPETEG